MLPSFPVPRRQVCGAGRRVGSRTACLLLSLAVLLLGGPAKAAVLWQIGAPDDRNAEFALAPQGYQRFKDDGFFVVGRSDPKTDWPYVHPGPADGWAGSRSHVFTVTFALKAAPTSGTCRLVVDFLDTQVSSPPHLRAEINGRRFETALPQGAGDASIYGDPSKGREHVWPLEFPADLLRGGGNEIALTTLNGSWALYDSLRLEVPKAVELVPEPTGTRLVRVDVPPLWRREGGQAVQPLTLTLRHVGDDTDAVVRLADRDVATVRLKSGLHRLEVAAAAEERTRVLPLTLLAGGTVVQSTNLTLAPPKIREVWVLPHSHVDVGYTHLQDQIVRIQIENLEKAMRLAEASAGNPPGLRFKWNPEAIWSLDHFLRQATPERREAFIASVRRGEVGVDALYGNMLTGLCRPEELAQSLAFGPKLAALTGVPVESAAICDVPGWTWGIVPTMAQAGVKYFAIGPNHSARIGTIHRWDNLPFYWRSQSGRDRVLCWVVDNYHHLGDLTQNVISHSTALAAGEFPYDMSFIYWVGAWPDGGVDNAPPDEELVQKAVAWNAQYAAPRVVIGLAGDFFREFERRHQALVPEFAGDLTPYWEDGAGSTARETALNRASAERLVQVEALFAMLAPDTRPAARIEEAWKNVLLYSEHTWGAHNSISQPDLPFVLDQWRVKQAFALDADQQSRDLLAMILASGGERVEAALDVFNTTQWRRTDLVLVPAELCGTALGVTDDRGTKVPSQRLASGELAFLATDVPPYGASRYRLAAAATPAAAGARIEGHELRTTRLTVVIDPRTGAIRSLRQLGWEGDLVNPASAVALNDFRYVLGTNAAAAQANGPVSINVVDPGPLVATLRIESGAPGCHQLVREVRVVEGLDRVELINHVDRLPVREKDSVHFGFGFQVPGGTVRMETPWGVVRPNVDQLPGACRNWFTVQRWVDVSNADHGVTWAPIDAPLMEVGGLTANLMGAVGYDEWLSEAIDSTTLYSWAQNNHWFTNYKADQPGVTTFRYALRAHRGGYSAADAARFGVESTRPLVVAAARPRTAPGRPLLSVSSPDVLVETVKVSEDGKALILRLFGVAGVDRSVRLRWGAATPAAVWLTDLTEKPLRKLEPDLDVPAYGIVSLRAELP